MSIHDHKAAYVYDMAKLAMHDDAKPARIASLADAATDAAVKAGQDGDIKFPGDDRCFRIELLIFRTLCEANGVNIDVIYEADQ